MQADRFSYLFQRYLDKSCSADERNEFMQAVYDEVNSDQLEELSAAALNNYNPGKQLSDDEANGLFDLIRKRSNSSVANDQVLFDLIRKRNNSSGANNDQLINEPVSNSDNTIYNDRPVNYPAVHRVHFLRTAWFRYAAAAVIILGIGVYLWNTNKPAVPVETKTVKENKATESILPGGQKATLILADGSTIILDSAANGQLTTQGNSKVIKLDDGQLIYDSERGSLSPAGGSTPGGAGREGGPATTNTMRTPRGGQYQLTLPDGSKVWLNSASSITYPTAFTEKTRTVSITGEAYFEIKPNPKQPFIVKTISDQIEVLGTSFNINSYADEPFVKTSLITGSISVRDLSPAGREEPRVARANRDLESNKDRRDDEGGPATQTKGKILKPGEAYINNKIIKTNLTQDLAWKNGYFSFEKTSLQAVMRQLSRWYDVDITYEGNIPARTFSGEIGRSLTLEQVLKGLSKTKINYRIESGNRIVILP